MRTPWGARRGPAHAVGRRAPEHRSLPAPDLGPVIARNNLGTRVFCGAVVLGFFGFVLFVVAGQGADSDALQIAAAGGLVAGFEAAIGTRRITLRDGVLSVVDLASTRLVPLRSITKVEVVNQLEITGTCYGRLVTIAPQAVEAAGLTIMLGGRTSTRIATRIDTLRADAGGHDADATMTSARLRVGIFILPIAGLVAYVGAAAIAGLFWYPEYFAW